MIPRLKPFFSIRELLAALDIRRKPVEDFEREFARTFEAKYALAFPYGRSALYAIFKALHIENTEVIMPAYTCVVVSHALVLSGNKPKFVDISLEDYNMDIDLVEKEMTRDTGAIIATHLFGYPLDTERIKEMAAKANKKIWIIQDCAHSFGAKFKGKFVCNEGDAAIFGLNISKQVSSLFGGMMTTNDAALYEKVKAYRDANFKKPSIFKQLRKFMYLLAVYAAFNETVYGIVNFIETNTHLLDRFTKYYEEDRIYLPSDFMVLMGNLEARIGLVQLKKYGEISTKRRAIAEYYSMNLQDMSELTLPPLIEGATYSHYVVRVKDRKGIMEKMRKKGVQLGELIEYSIPHMESYLKCKPENFPNSFQCSRGTINLPNYPSLSKSELEHIVKNLQSME
ncbi:MAG TPA: hypothetical protein HA257_04445 [Candidatus Methanoperedenaceae archaeon]|nr:hypothetical protein [Candidatus Methanoperedenaceae archaeon]